MLPAAVSARAGGAKGSRGTCSFLKDKCFRRDGPGMGALAVVALWRGGASGQGFLPREGVSLTNYLRCCEGY